jgi:Beta-lactamase
MAQPIWSMACLTPATVFPLASVSKQFTAFVIYLLVQDGRLSLDDDVRKYLPKLHHFGKVITIRQLLHHTSGVRDQSNLLTLAGWRLDDVITDDDVARVLFQQTELNFTPGDQFLYSNSGYTLLAMVVKQVAGKTLPAFAKERITQHSAKIASTTPVMDRGALNWRSKFNLSRTFPAPSSRRFGPPRVFDEQQRIGMPGSWPHSINDVPDAFHSHSCVGSLCGAIAASRDFLHWS